ncbi:MAG: hypothetical protein Q9226_008997, partial [Calogaya cf. arnoldii]
IHAIIHGIVGALPAENGHYMDSVANKQNALFRKVIDFRRTTKGTTHQPVENSILSNFRRIKDDAEGLLEVSEIFELVIECFGDIDSGWYRSVGSVEWIIFASEP